MFVRKPVAEESRSWVRSSRVGAVSWAALILGLASNAQAQSSNFYLDRAQLSLAPDDGYTVWRPQAAPGGRVYASAILGYSHNPLRRESVTNDVRVKQKIDNLIEGQFLTYVGIGSEFNSHVAANIVLPITVYQFAGADPQGEGIGSGGIGDNKSAAHDLRIDLRLHALRADQGPVHFGVGAAGYVPTGNRRAFAGDGQLTGWVYAAAEVVSPDLIVSGQVGPHFRPDRPLGGEKNELFVGSELRWAFGVYIPLRTDRVRLGVELWGSTGIATKPNGKSTFFTPHNTDVEWLGQARFQLSRVFHATAGAGSRTAVGYGGPDFRVMAGLGATLGWLDFASPPPPKQHKPDTDLPYLPPVDRDQDGDGYPDTIDKCPTAKEDGRGPEPSDGCPGPADRDNDGIPDKSDRCPDDPEDKDNLEDHDGCPDVDVDNDSVPDTEDHCPLDPGPASKDLEKNGCPTLTRVTEEGKVALLQPIEFETGKAVIKPASYPIVDEVVALLKARPDLRLAVHGHTDNKGLPAKNLELSRARAAAVVRYLVEHGINDVRLESAGFGQTKPLAENTTEEGRARNRRVELTLVNRPHGASEPAERLGPAESVEHAGEKPEPSEPGDRLDE